MSLVDAAQVPGARDLTICTVSFRSRDLLELNVALAERLNPGRPLRWIVVENTPPGESWLAPRDRVTVLPGPPPPGGGGRAAGVHHAAGLNVALREVTTRYVLVLDPDFFIVRACWADVVLDWMARADIAVFGVPWHPKWFTKRRYLPAPHCLFMDRERLGPPFDFTPGSVETQQLPLLSRFRGYSFHGRRAFHYVERVADALLQRWRVGTARETGDRLRERLDSIKVACALPVYRVDEDYPARSWPRVNQAIDRMMPERFSFAPKRRDSYATEGLREAGYPELAELQCEEFMWQGRPLGFHLRGQKRKTADPGAELRTLAALLARMGAELAVVGEAGSSAEGNGRMS